jgi:hypothetical protein
MATEAVLPAIGAAGAAAGGVMAYLQRVATVGTLIKTLVSLVLALVGGAMAVYGYFAKTSELHALQCSVIDQNALNNQVIQLHERVRESLTLLQQNLQNGGDANTSRQVALTMKANIDSMGAEFKAIQDKREKIMADSIRADRKC